MLQGGFFGRGYLFKFIAIVSESVGKILFSSVALGLDAHAHKAHDLDAPVAASHPKPASAAAAQTHERPQRHGLDARSPDPARPGPSRAGSLCRGPAGDYPVLADSSGPAATVPS